MTTAVGQHDAGWQPARGDGAVENGRLGSAMRRATGKRVRWCDSDSLRPQTGATQQIVGERVQQHDAAHLAAAAHQDLPKIPLAHLGEQAFQLRADPVHPLAEGPAHQLAPDRHSGTIARLRRIRVLAVAPMAGRDHRGGIVGPGPLDVGEPAEPAVGQIPRRRPAIAVLELLEHRTQLADIAAAGVDRDPDDHLTVGIARHLHVVGWPETAVRHLHHPRLGIRGRGAHRLGLVFRIAPGRAHLTFDLELAQPHQRLTAALLALGGRPQPGGLFATLAGRRIALQVALELLDPLGHPLADRGQPALPPERCRPGGA
jgi:hypothetical protein